MYGSRAQREVARSLALPIRDAPCDEIMYIYIYIYVYGRVESRYQGVYIYIYIYMYQGVSAELRLI